MNPEEEKTVRRLFVSGIIGERLFTLISEKKDSDNDLTIMAGAALIATSEAHQRALKIDVKLITEENGCLYESTAGGPRKFLRKLEKPAKQLSVYFKLK